MLILEVVVVLEVVMLMLEVVVEVVMLMLEVVVVLEVVLECLENCFALKGMLTRFEMNSNMYHATHHHE